VAQAEVLRHHERAGKLRGDSQGLEVADHGLQGTSTARIPASAGTAPGSLGLETHLAGGTWLQ